MEPMIKIENVSKTFRGKENSVEALKGISLEIGAGDIYGIIGMSGAGKSTLVRCLNFLERPTEGTVYVEGKDLSAMSERQLRGMRSRVAMIFQHFNLLMQRTVLDNVCFPLEIAGVSKKEAREKARKYLEIVELSDKEKAYPAQLSGGQKQRVAIARMLMQKAPLMVFDDSLSAVDAETDAKIRAALREQMEGATVILISHRITTLMQADRILVLDGGRVADMGTHAELIARPGIYREIYDIQMSSDDRRLLEEGGEG